MISRIFNYQRFLFRRLIFQFTTWLGRFQARMAGFTLGNGARFYGKPFFLKAKSATGTIGRNCNFRSSPTSNLIGINRPCIVSVHNNAKLSIGTSCGFSGTVIGCFDEIVIEDNVRCGANTLITDSDWHLDDPRSGSPKPIHIHRNVWLGVGVMVLKGVSIGENSVIGAGSVVTRDVPSNVIAAGNPCKVIRPQDDWIIKNH